jgi:hypothetical protein
MALLFINDGSDDTLAHYDEVVKHLEAAGHGHPPGRLSHVTPRKWNTAGSARTSSSSFAPRCGPPRV